MKKIKMMKIKKMKIKMMEIKKIKIEKMKITKQEAHFQPTNRNAVYLEQNLFKFLEVLT